jgi:dsDNA-binding SOS-regulon protein
MSFASKKEADAYDKMLDLAEVLNDWLVACPLTLDEEQRDSMAMWLAERKDALNHILRSGKLPEARDARQDAPRRRRPPKPRRVMKPAGGEARKAGGLNAAAASTGGRLRCCRRDICASLAADNIS